MAPPTTQGEVAPIASAAPAGAALWTATEVVDGDTIHVDGPDGEQTVRMIGINAPERVDRLVLLCTSPKMGPAEMWVDRAKTVREQGTDAIVDGTFERWFTADYRSTHDVGEWRAMFVGVGDEGYANCCGILETLDLTDGLPQVKAPTLVIAGAQDPSTPPDDHAAVIAGAIPHARLEVVDPGAHLLNVERSDAVTDLIRDHLS